MRTLTFTMVGFLLIIVFSIIFCIGITNGLVRKEEDVFNAFGNLDSSLQRRYDLIPNLVATVKGYAAHEAKTLETVIAARADMSKIVIDASKLSDPKVVSAFMQQQSQLNSALSRLLAVSESYPDLKANQNFMDLQHQLEGTENRINYARNQLNEKIRIFNSSIRSFPASLINAVFTHLEKKAVFEAASEAKNAVKVDFS